MDKEEIQEMADATVDVTVLTLKRMTTDDELYRLQAKGTMMFYRALRDEGFDPPEAMQIVVASFKALK